MCARLHRYPYKTVFISFHLTSYPLHVIIDIESNPEFVIIDIVLIVVIVIVTSSSFSTPKIVHIHLETHFAIIGCVVEQQCCKGDSLCPILNPLISLTP